MFNSKSSELLVRVSGTIILRACESTLRTHALQTPGYAPVYTEPALASVGLQRVSSVAGRILSTRGSLTPKYRPCET